MYSTAVGPPVFHEANCLQIPQLQEPGSNPDPVTPISNYSTTRPSSAQSSLSSHSSPSVERPRRRPGGHRTGPLNPEQNRRYRDNKKHKAVCEFHRKQKRAVSIVSNAVAKYADKTSDDEADAHLSRGPSFFVADSSSATQTNARTTCSIQGRCITLSIYGHTPLSPTSHHMAQSMAEALWRRIPLSTHRQLFTPPNPPAQSTLPSALSIHLAMP
jgi:hypothetical protein